MEGPLTRIDPYYSAMCSLYTMALLSAAKVQLFFGMAMQNANYFL